MSLFRSLLHRGKDIRRFNQVERIAQPRQALVERIVVLHNGGTSRAIADVLQQLRSWQIRQSARRVIHQQWFKRFATHRPPPETPNLPRSVRTALNRLLFTVPSGQSSVAATSRID